jgi:hypothetical protein
MELNGKQVDRATDSNGVMVGEPEVPVQGCPDSNQDREATYVLHQADVCDLMMLDSWDVWVEA